MFSARSMQRNIQSRDRLRVRPSSIFSVLSLYFIHRGPSMDDPYHSATIGSCPDLVVEYPRVLRAASLTGVDDQQGLRLQRDARQPAGRDADAVRNEDEGPQIDVARGETFFGHDRCGR